MPISGIQQVSIRKLRVNPKNARTPSGKQIRQIAESIRRFGWTYPILVDEENAILAGHGRHQAAEHLGLREVPVIVMAGLSEAEKQFLVQGHHAGRACRRSCRRMP